MKFNMNDRATVRLTSKGLELLDEHELGLGLPQRYRRKEVTDGNVWRGELWALMATFGAGITMGMDIPFVDNLIEVEPRD